MVDFPPRQTGYHLVLRNSLHVASLTLRHWICSLEGTLERLEVRLIPCSMSHPPLSRKIYHVLDFILITWLFQCDHINHSLVLLRCAWICRHRCLLLPHQASRTLEVSIYSRLFLLVVCCQEYSHSGWYRHPVGCTNQKSTQRSWTGLALDEWLFVRVSAFVKLWENAPC